MKSQSNYYSNQKISNCATPSQQPFRRKYYHSNKKPKRVYSSSTQPLPQNHQANIICFQHCAVWSLKLSTITNSNKKCISQRSIEGKIAQVYFFFLPSVYSSLPTSVSFSFPSLVFFKISNSGTLYHTMGLIRIELMTPSLSEKCSNRLSYSPNIK